jgi:bifunctional DNA-binding transcriptional regulator/antitoxin component of YhaV-PrlF toxin-antitoxin module
MPRPPKEDLETIIARCRDEQKWRVYSCIPKDVRRLRKFANELQLEIKEMGHGGIEVLVPLSSFRIPTKLIRKRTEKQILASRRAGRLLAERRNSLGTGN